MEATAESAGVVELLQIRCGRRDDDGEWPFRLFRHRWATPATCQPQFVPRGSADARDETKVLTATRARQLMEMPTGDDLVDYHDRAILKVYLYTGIRLTTGCRLKVSDFNQEGEATLKLHEKGDKRRTIGLHFNAAQAIGEYIEKAGITSGPLFRAQAAPRSCEKLSNRPMDSATMYRNSIEMS